jgi:tripartite-type tricarboxylate transporter receptor subunit TctC
MRAMPMRMGTGSAAGHPPLEGEGGSTRHMPRVIICAAFATIFIGALPTAASAQAEFYRGKSITLVVGSDITGEHDAAARLLSRHLGRHIPGRPSIVVQNMPGASGIKSANYLYEIARRDGTVIATFNKSMPLYQATGMANTNYKSEEFNWIGSMDHANMLVVVAARTGVQTIADATRKEVLMGSIGAGGTMSTYPLLLNNAFGTKFRLVQGYAGGQIVDLAMDRGEVDGRGSYNWRDLRVKRANWLKEKKVNILVQFGLEREADLPEVPLLVELARNDRERKVLTFVSSDIPIGKSFVMPPAVPADRVEAIRKAFEATMKDPDFLADATAAEADVHLIPGAQVQTLVREIVATPAEIVRTAQDWMTAK